MKTLLTFASFIIMCTLTFGQLLPDIGSPEGHKSDMEETINPKWIIPEVASPVMHNLQKLSTTQIPQAPLHPEGHKSDLEQNTISQWTVPQVSASVMHDLQELTSISRILDVSHDYYANLMDLDLVMIPIDCTLPLVPVLASGYLQDNSGKFLNSKLGDESLMKLDSSVSNSEKKMFSYNHDRRLIETSNFVKMNNGLWQPYSKIELSEVENTQQRHYSQYNTNTDQWDLVYKYDVIYNESGAIVEFKSYTWQPKMALWFAEVRGEYIYNEGGNITEFSINQWNGYAFETYFELIAFYTDQNVLLQSIEKVHDPEENQLVNIRLISNNINSDHRIENTLISFWNSEIGGWENKFLSAFIYNNQGLVYSKENSLWNEPEEAFVRESRTEYFYQMGNQITGEINLVWSDEFDEWVGLDKYQRVLDGYGNQSTIIYSYWNSEINNWSPLIKTERQHDTSVSVEFITVPANFPHSQSMLLQEDEYYYDQGNYVSDGSTTYFYSSASIISNTSKTSADPMVDIYPNPCRDILNVGVSQSIPYTFELYDITGKQITRQTLSGRSQIKTSDLSSGIYIYRIHTSGTEITGKIVKD